MKQSSFGGLTGSPNEAKLSHMGKTSDARKAGHSTAVADFGAGKFHVPLKSDRRDWAQGYRAAILDLAATFGKDAINRALPEGVKVP